MSSFKEFLEDYEAKEIQDNIKFLERLRKGKVSQNERYPPKERFIKLQEPIALAPYSNIWGIVPFYGSTLVPLLPRSDKKAFDEIHRSLLGFSSRNIDKMVDLAKDTGRIQFGIGNATSYKNLDFLEPLFNELKPPYMPSGLKSLIGNDMYREYLTEFDTLANFGFARYIYDCNLNAGINAAKRELIEAHGSHYISLKVLGYGELADEIGSLMITNPRRAAACLYIFGGLIADPQFSTLKPIYNFDKEFMTIAHRLGKSHGIGVHENIPYEVGKFLLNKIVHYPETLDGCVEVIQKYDDYELYKILGALDEGVKRKKNDIIEDKRAELSEVLDNIWKDADKIKRDSERIRLGASLSIGLIGELAVGTTGLGVLAGLGFNEVDRFWGEKSESISEKIAKFVYPNYLVAIFDFKNKTIK